MSILAAIGTVGALAAMIGCLAVVAVFTPMLGWYFWVPFVIFWGILRIMGVPPLLRRTVRDSEPAPFTKEGTSLES